ncbi:hypothetical protein PWT90_03564 [Aphanocladium album]|nr:hypothetical protein PWT90_03564 [Aphanocladium album]
MQQHGLVRRRRRQVLSCLACRRRKIKCNREQPCQHCIQTQQQCSYQRPPSPVQWQDPKLAEQPRDNNWRAVIFSPENSAPDAPEDVATEHRAASTPGAVLQKPPASQPTPPAKSVATSHESQRARILSQLPKNIDCFWQRKFAAHDSKIVLDKTRILRWTHWMGAEQEFGPIFACYMEILGPQQDSLLPPDAKAVLSEAAELLQKCKRLARSSKIWRPSRLFGMQGYDLMPPSREAADTAAAEYLKYFESTIRILHIPSFQKAYESFWENQNTTKMETKLIVLLVIAIGSSLQAGSDDSTATRSIAQVHQWIYAAQAWLAGPLEKDRLDIGGLQIYCLVILARQIYSVGGDLVFMSLGSLLHRAMQLGLHYDPKHFQGMSLFKAEMRRRLWYTILEFLIQAALDTAMPPRILKDEFDTEPPSNINDCDLDKDTQDLHVKPEFEYTDTSMQLHLIHALIPRMRIIRYLNAIKTDLVYTEAMVLDQALGDAQRRATFGMHDYGTRVSPFQRNMVDFFLRRFTVPLHSPFACEARTTPTFHSSLKACCDASLALINPEPDERFERLLDFAGGLFREGLRSANTAISLDLIIQTKMQQADGTLHRTRLLRDALKQSVTDMLKRCDVRIHNGETNVKSFVFLSMVLAMAEAIENDVPCEMRIAESARDAIKHCYDILEKTIGSFGTNTPTEPGFPSNEVDMADLGFDMMDHFFSDAGFLYHTS